jgi:protein-disulfide isomerase
MEKTNWIVALVVGALVGFFVGHYTAGPSSSANNGANGNNNGPVVLNNNNASDQGKTPGDLPPSYIKESEFPAGTFTGLTDQQKYTVLKVANERNCTCGCPNDTIAKCRTHDPTCTTAPGLLNDIIADAKRGLSSAQIEQKMGGGNKAAPPSRPSDDPNTVYKVPIGDAPVKGNHDAKVTMVEFSDFQCPFCGRASGTVDQMEAKYGNDLRVVYKQNPLPFHNHAMEAAEASMAAGAQGKFWEMYDVLFKNQQHLERADLEKYAQQIGLDMNKFKADMDSHRFKDQIEKDKAQAAQLGATGTPAFFINGHKLVGAQPPDAFSKVIDEQKAAAEKVLASGVSSSQLYDTLIAKGVTSPPAAPPGAPNAPQAPQVRKVDIANFNPSRGAQVAPVTIVEWSDFQCPFCGRVEPTIKQIMDTYGSKVKVVWRNQPLPFHPFAMPAAKAAMAANEQGRFWEMHDKMFANQQNLKPEDLERYARESGLDVNKWKADMESPKVKEEIDADSKYGQTVGANGTPTFFINGKEVGGAQPFDSFKVIIDDQLKKAEELQAKGVKTDELYGKLIEANIAAAPAPAPAPMANPNAAPDAIVSVDVGDSPSHGPARAPVTIVEFSDFQCPFCGRAYQTLNDVEKKYEGKVKVVFKQNPLPFHQHAELAAEASLAAGEQGKFWEMYDLMFKNQQHLERADLEKYAEQAGLDMNRFKSALDSNKFKDKVQAELKQGQAVGVTGTPTFVINGHKLVGAQPIDAFSKVIDDALAHPTIGNVAGGK